MSNPTVTSQVNPVVLILNLDKNEMFEGLFDAIYADLIRSLTSKYRVQRARDPDVAQRYLSDSENHPVAILIVDAGAVRLKNARVLDLVKSYVKSGGIAVFIQPESCFSEERRSS